MQKIHKIIFTLAVVLCVGLPSVFADESRCPWDMGMKGMKYKMDKEGKIDLDDKFYHKVIFILANSSELELSDTQIEKIMALKYRVKKSMIAREAEINSLNLDIMHNLSKEDMVDLNVFNELIEKKHESKKMKEKELIADILELKEILTKDQRKKLKEKFTRALSYKMKWAMDDDMECKMMQKEEPIKKEKEK
ncbi:MAG TPA: hypothetical protein PLU24_04620 [Candidatus Omnitrophota bacterium]|nr:hypothetical protein [Candidatus Omnitrophota bacterium]